MVNHLHNVLETPFRNRYLFAMIDTKSSSVSSSLKRIIRNHDSPYCVWRLEPSYSENYILACASAFVRARVRVCLYPIVIDSNLIAFLIFARLELDSLKNVISVVLHTITCARVVFRALLRA